jgi:hypothetical protein
MRLALISTLVAKCTIFLSRRVVLPASADRRKHPRPRQVPRTPGKSQGRALEVLAHALEYLVDSELNRESLNCESLNRESLNRESKDRLAVQEAAHLLAEKSRAVFAECPKVATFSQRIGRWLPEFLTLPGLDEVNEFYREQGFDHLEVWHKTHSDRVLKSGAVPNNSLQTSSLSLKPIGTPNDKSAPQVPAGSAYKVFKTTN